MRKLPLTENEIRDLYSLLKRVSFFASITVGDLDRVVQGFNKAVCAKGERLIKEGVPGKALYIIKTGKCGVFKKKGFFSKQLIATLEPGGICGEMSLLDATQTNASVSMLEAGEVFVYEKRDFIDMLSKNRELEAQIRRLADERSYKNVISRM
ncbi:MAG: cyclic nucleotide-binding domain-containing protein [Endomicrobiales bacterium]|nr:cyclic nucleotide-binding domain-containing protein [Endomicrobiales bacterium]